MLIGAIETHFTGWDWAVVAFYMVFTTWIGHVMSGKAATVKDFFLGGRSMPWWAVSGSMIATEISALTFIGVPGGVYAAQGDWTYLQWGIGSIIARFIVGYWLVPLYYAREIYSPYDFMGNRLGEPVRKLVTLLFSLGAILGQSVRVLVTAVILYAVTGWSMTWCIVAIGVFALAWTLMGGMRTVIWTDVIQFGVFLLGGVLALSWLVSHLGWDEIVAVNRGFTTPEGVAVDKMRIFDFTLPWENSLLNYTFWVGVIAMPFQNLAAFGTDQLNAQRMFCCGSQHEARKAMLWSSVAIATTLLMLAVGSGLFAWYQIKGLTPDEAAKFAEDPNNVFPVWIVTVLPPGLTGLILAGAFAAAISSLDSVLAALSQTTLSAVLGREKVEAEEGSARMVKLSRWTVVIWAIFLTSFAVWMAASRKDAEDKNLIDLAFGMVAYTYGPLLGILLAAILQGRRSFIGIVIGVVLSMALVAWVRPELPRLLEALQISPEALVQSRPQIAFPWFYPINAILTLACSMLPIGRIERDTDS
ncbi:transporter [Haloferula helveola]|uniref:Transporter n=1 Tax=Haloferula helveola TaxID=490095 RepID=A0ABM7RKQ5_9BACT|nr:transporter [Haloferula helveola]